MEEDDIFAPTVARIRIINHNKFEMQDRCDNVLYRFPPGQAVDIPLDAAMHLFGFHMEAEEEETRKHCCKRFGWNTVQCVKDGNDRVFFENLSIQPVTYKMVEVTDDDEGFGVRRRRGRPPKAQLIPQEAETSE